MFVVCVSLVQNMTRIDTKTGLESNSGKNSRGIENLRNTSTPRTGTRYIQILSTRNFPKFYSKRARNRKLYA